ncbi:MAG: thermonuclease family protein [Nitriliruptor sp.]
MERGSARRRGGRVASAVLLALVVSACVPAAGGGDDAAGTRWTVERVIDGDTVHARSSDGAEERVRVIGIDSPERGECGFGPATGRMTDLVAGREVELVVASRAARDRYDRLLAYVDVDGVDAGLTLVEEGLAVARYDSRDGYERHPREDRYVAADAAVEHVCR